VCKTETGKEKESTNICHLSDFDLYTPTAKQKKILKAPKKICFATKSQQKAAMFLEGQNFAHFFCSSSKAEADSLYKALHSWRSWYLVHVLGEGEKKPTEPRMFSMDIERRPGTAQSTDTVPYQLGSFKPLLDFSDLAFGADSETKGNGHQRVSSDLSSGNLKRLPRNQGAPPSSFPKLTAPGTVESNARDDVENQPFTGTGLLARSASRRTQGGQHSGRGVTGVKGKPLVDLSGNSEFAEGSLLRKLEAWSVQNGEVEHKIDREKRVETNIKVGEGA
jgi:hypothetical protein